MSWPDVSIQRSTSVVLFGITPEPKNQKILGIPYFLVKLKLGFINKKKTEGSQSLSKNKVSRTHF